MAKSSSLKPFRIDDHRLQNGTVEETVFNKWRGMILANIRKETEWARFTKSGAYESWGDIDTPKRGITAGTDQDAIHANLLNMLEYISQYGPSRQYREITERCTSLEDIFDRIRSWAGIKPMGSSLKQYYKVKKAYQKNDQNSNVTDLYYEMKDLSSVTYFSGWNVDEIQGEGKYFEIYGKYEAISLITKNALILEPGNKFDPLAGFGQATGVNSATNTIPNHVIGLTTKSDLEIKLFHLKMFAAHPHYNLFTFNCRHHAEALALFLTGVKIGNAISSDFGNAIVLQN